MFQLLSPQQFHVSASGGLLDLRSATRFRKGTLPDAVSFPLEERGNPEEIEQQFAQRWPSQTVRVFDQEGEAANFFHSFAQVQYLQGGYTAYLRWQDELFSKGPRIVILGGKAGTGKTELLGQLSIHGEQVIDLEHLAEHKGSVFGNLTSNAQPTTDAFRHRVFDQWFRFNTQQCVWIEEEGPFLGSAAVPPVLYERMLDAPLLHLEMDFAKRLEHILAEYGSEPAQQFIAAIRKLETRMGMSANQKALHLYTSGNIAGAFRLLLQYYDRAYDERRTKYRRGTQSHFPADENPESVMDALIATGKLL